METDVEATTAIGQDLLEQLSRRLALEAGLDYPTRKWPELAHKVARLARTVGILDASECARWLLSATSPEPIEALVALCTVGETYFFREPESLEFFIKNGLAELGRAAAAAGRPVRIWSAGCCTGEEPYSIAIGLLECGFWPGRLEFEILGTDINADFLARAREARYGQWSFRKTPGRFRQRYFRAGGKDLWTLDQEVRRRVHFEQLNLAADRGPGRFGLFDAIFCRNVLMYFTEGAVSRVLAAFKRNLTPNGWLVLSPTESSILHESGLARDRLPPFIGLNKPRGANEPVEQVFWAGGMGGISLPLEPAVEHTPPVFTTIVPAAIYPPEPVDAPAPDWVGNARELMDAGLANAAIEMLSQHPALRSDAAATLLMARLHYLDESYAEALAWCRAALETDSLNQKAHHLAGCVLREQGDLAGALESLKRAVYSAPDTAGVHLDLGFVYRDLGQPEQGRRHFRNAAELFARGDPEEILAEVGDMTAGRMASIARSMAEKGRAS